MGEVLAALLASNARLAGPGYTGQGHFYECPNGHPYVIGDCGGAMQEAACPECGERIGGRSCNLTRGNRPSERLQQVAQAAIQVARGHR